MTKPKRGMIVKYHNDNPSVVPHLWLDTINKLGNIHAWPWKDRIFCVIGGLASYDKGTWFETADGFRFQQEQVEAVHAAIESLLINLKFNDISNVKQKSSWPNPESNNCERVMLINAQTIEAEMVIYVDRFGDHELDQYHFTIGKRRALIPTPEPITPPSKPATSPTVRSKSAKRRMTLDEYTAEAVSLFGEDMMLWKWVCPSCGFVASAQDYKDGGAPEGAVGFSCVGRWRDDAQEAFTKHVDVNRPCNYAGGGLFGINPILIEVEGETVRGYFDFYRGDETAVDEQEGGHNA